MSFKLLACDLDKTLMDEVPILPDIKDFIVKVRGKGIKFAINSGRYLKDILEILSQSKVSCPDGYPEAIVSGQGVFIHYLKGNHYVEDKQWNEEREKELEILSQEIGWKSKLWEKLIEEKFKIKPVKKEIDQGVFRVFFNSEEEAEKIRQALMKNGDFKYTAFIRNRHIILATLSTTHKGNALMRVAEHFNICPCEILAIGDSHNDEDMLDGRYGFIPGAPSNAEEGIKLLVKANNGYVASQPEGMGVVEIVDYLLAKST
ncbi:HAD family phosphatase [Candidatus Aerophobetes bacterium]|nr:HAD family phosphatase [Candidatus Aerophobetes bacterium]